MAETNVTCGAIDATATVKVNSAIQVVAQVSIGHGVVKCKRKKLESHKDIVRR